MARKLTEAMTKLTARFIDITRGKKDGEKLYQDVVERTIAGLMQCHGEDAVNKAMDVLESHWINNMAWWDGKPIEPMALLAQSCLYSRAAKVTEQEVDKMVYMIFTREEDGEEWLEYAEWDGDLARVKKDLEAALEDHNRDNVRLCVVKDFGITVEVEL